MATRLDVARALKGSSSGTSKTAAASNVRYGTASGASVDGQVTVVLDGSTEAVTLKTDADVARGERVRVVSQGGSYAVVALKGVSAAASAAKTAADTANTTATAASTAASQAAGEAAAAKEQAAGAAADAKQALADAGDAATKAVEVSDALDTYKVSVSETYATQDSLAELSSTVTQTAEDITSEFSAVVGGRNLLLGTSVQLTPAGNGGTNQNGGMYYFAAGKYAKLEPSTTYTFAFTAKASAATTGTVLWQLNASPWAGFSKSTSLTTTATRHAYTLTTPASSTSAATAVMARMDNVPTTVTVTLSDVTLVKGAADPGWSPSPQDTSTLIRQSGDGVEVARKVNGSYVGTRATLGSDSLAFTDRTGVTTLAEFGADGATLGSALGQHVSIGTDSFSIVDKTLNVLVNIGSNSLGPYIDGDGSLELRSSDTLPTAEVELGTTTSGSTKTGTAKLSANNPSNVLKGATLTLDSSSGLTFAVDSAAKLKVTSTTLACSALKAVPEAKTLVSSTVTAYRHMGMVTVRLDNYVTDKITAAGSYSVGTLPAGWHPPARVKAPLYCNPLANLFFYVETGGTVKVYAPDKVSSTTQMSGTVTFIATQ